LLHFVSKIGSDNEGIIPYNFDYHAQELVSDRSFQQASIVKVHIWIAVGSNYTVWCGQGFLKRCLHVHHFWMCQDVNHPFRGESD
jgi:hypothetical protein